jgi:hypothetical protein
MSQGMKMKRFTIIRNSVVLGCMGFMITSSTWAQPKPEPDDPAVIRPIVHKTYYPVSETPWFSDPGVRRELGVNDEEYSRLHEGYGQAWDRYDQKRLQMSPTISEQERLKQNDDLHGAFHSDVAKLPQDRVANSIMRQRYNQLYWQHRGIGAFNDADMQKRLELNPSQRLKFRDMERDWNSRMDGLRRTYSADPDRILKRFNEGRTEFNEGIRSLLDEKQLEGWKEMTGKPYEFPPEVYFQKNAVARPAVK